MKPIDLSHFIDENMPVYPGTESPRLEAGCSVEKDGFLERKITLFSHTGTHMDAPSHLLADGKMLDDFPIDHFFGNAALVNISTQPGEEIGVDVLNLGEQQLHNLDFIVMHSGWSEYWGKEQYFVDFPVLSKEAAEWLTQFNLKGIGMDMISIDGIESHALPIHKIFLKKDIVIIENLTNLEAIPEEQFTLACFPLKLKEADGSPIRAVAIC